MIQQLMKRPYNCTTCISEDIPIVSITLQTLSDGAGLGGGGGRGGGRDVKLFTSNGDNNEPKKVCIIRIYEPNIHRDAAYSKHTQTYCRTWRNLICVAVSFIVGNFVALYYRQDLARAENKAKLAEHKAELITRLFDVITQSACEQ